MSRPSLLTSSLALLLALPSLLLPEVNAAPYDERWVDYNINTNPNSNATVQEFTTYKFSANETYMPSPTNWRTLPAYTILLDKWSDNDAANNDYFNTTFEHTPLDTQLRHGGDIKGLVSDRSLDYFELLGVKVIYISGTPYLNMPWQADGYSTLDFTIFDPHWGTIQDWADAIQLIHNRGMYIVVDSTISTMGNLIAMEGHLNTSAPFRPTEYDALWNRAPYGPWDLTEYPDFTFNNAMNDTCVLPQFWDTAGQIVNVDKGPGCYDSVFDQYGDMEAFGVHPDWQRQLAKFSSVQDRLREWRPDVGADLMKFPCLMIESLDIDGIRIDKATQLTVGYVADWSTSVRACARRLGKDNFYIPGEIVGGDIHGSLYIGRGRTPYQSNRTFEEAVSATPSDSGMFMREEGLAGYDSTAFHYSFYRSLLRVLQMDGDLSVADDVSIDFATAWRQININEDMINSQTGLYDPRHWMGVTNHDVFRWPAMVNGTQKQAFGNYVGMLMIPGIPLIYYGEEQGMYLFDNTASNYLFGRQAMTATPAWERHGCYKLGSTQYHNFEFGKALFGCQDPWNALDHLDPTAPGFRYLQRIFNLRNTYPALTDGFEVNLHSSQTYFIQFPGSGTAQTEIGLRSNSRSTLTSQLNTEQFLGEMTEDVWLLWHNENRTTTYAAACGDGDDPDWIQSPYPGPVTVKNLFYPYETLDLVKSLLYFNLDGQEPTRACLPEITLEPFGFRAYVPEDIWLIGPPVLTGFSPGHDARLLTIPGSANETSFEIALEYDQEMDCESVTANLRLNYFGPGTTTPSFEGTTGTCIRLENQTPPAELSGVPPSGWRYTRTIQNAPDGVYEILAGNSSTFPSGGFTGADAHLLVRKGALDNAMVWTSQADYSKTLLTGSAGSWTLNHAASGAERFRYSGTYGLSWSPWADYEETTSISDETFDDKFWDDQHIQVQYWSALAGSAAPLVHGDSSTYTGGERRVPKILARGDFNQFGYDQGIPSAFKQSETTGDWELPIIARWPSFLQINVYGFDDYFFGDADGDGVMDRLPPNSLTANYFNMTAPPVNKLGWTLSVNDKSGKWSLVPRGHASFNIVVFFLFLIIPPLTAILTAVLYQKRFYAIKVNKYGVKAGKESSGNEEKDSRLGPGQKIIGWPEDEKKRRKVLLATLEYEIMDWNIKVKIGGLGVMSKLMASAMTDCDMIWVIPKVGGIVYPAGESTEPIEVVIFGEVYLIECEIHVYQHITYYILDSPVFRAQTKSDPYPARMDDLSSAVFYSTWNQAIAEAIRRNPTVDIYHINDYHGTLAPLYLLPKVFPTCLSLHNAEFQGLWPLRNKDEMNEVCAAFNLPTEVTTKYVGYGNTFNLLHAGAAFIAAHQKSIGVAGVSDKYGKRSWARYPALWILKQIDSLPNPDPDDIEALDQQQADVKNVQIDAAAEAKRPGLKRQAQEWAGIKQDPNAQLFVFVGRWSKQKGVDIIADVFPALLEKNKSIQLIAVGPVIDLYGRFAAEKLARLMEMYPQQVFSKPEFTSLPPALFSGADFALIPSRDEPFGLVAVEFGRKGALGVGARLGGLGLMPGWWFPVESTSTSHMISQLQKTIKLALKSTEQERAVLRARSAVQRFPVLEWRGRMEIFQKKAIRASRKGAGTHAYDYSDYVAPSAPSPNRQYGDATRIERAEWSNRSPMDHPQATYGEDGSSSPHGSPEIMDPFDANARFDGDAPRSPRRFGGSDYGGSQDSQHSSDLSRSESDEDRYPRTPSEYGNPPRLTDLEREAGDRSSSYANFLSSANKQIARQAGTTKDPFFSSQGSIREEDGGALTAPSRPFTVHSRRSSHSSISSIVDEHGSSSPLNKAMVTFTDKDGEVTQDFVQKLKALNSDNSKGDLCVEKYLQKAEKAHFVVLRREKIENSKGSGFDSSSQAPSIYTAEGKPNDPDDNLMAEVPLTRMQIFMGRMIGKWPLYSIVMSCGQLLSATAFQLVLLSGTATQQDLDLYVVGAVFFTASIVWWALFRLKPAVVGLAFPWIFFAIAFFLIGIPSLGSESLREVQTRITSGATWSYAIASSAGFLFFGMNFGEEAGATTESWVFRACVVQGLQQCWTAVLWWWGSTFIGTDSSEYVAPLAILFIVWPLAVISLFFFLFMWWGLPQYYLQAPPTVPNFYATLFRRNVVKWFLIAEVLRDFWLSPPYGRNWSYLWKNPAIPVWATAILVIVFFVFVWGGILAVLTRFAKVHSWLLPIVAIGLGAPRWCQMFWGTSGIALNMAWAGKIGPFLGSALWLYLGVLDNIQGVGLGMLLLQTLSRFHVCAAIFFCQCLGAIVVVIARAASPGRLGPGTVFPNFALWDLAIDGMAQIPLRFPLFWICLLSQISIVVGYLWLFRKEQLTKP
ncbi:putative alpha-1,3-glucan synthase [Mrakia frigida]|uniref:putative alpha-1,3-glucan synthase n=1 Tax=Mrakia frigida TaxID=29902 RepID=UPI003FCC1182